MIALVLIAVLVGLGGGYGIGYVIYQPQLQNLQNDLNDLSDKSQGEFDNLDAKLTNLNSTLGNTLGNTQSSVTSLQDQLTSLNSEIADLNSTSLRSNGLLEEILAQLRKKPGEWVTQTVATERYIDGSDYWVWEAPYKCEVYICTSDARNVFLVPNSMMTQFVDPPYYTAAITVGGYWCPLESQSFISNIDPVTGDVTYSNDTNFQMRSQGWILDQGTLLICLKRVIIPPGVDVAIMVRARPDLE